MWSWFLPCRHLAFLQRSLVFRPGNDVPEQPKELLYYMHTIARVSIGVKYGLGYDV